MLQHNKILCIAIIFAGIFAGCSSSSETTKQTTETVEIKPITVKPPIVEYQQQLPMVEPDAGLLSPFGKYFSIDTVDVKTPEGKSKAVVKTKAILKKDKTGKPFLETHSVIEQDSFKVEGKVVSKKEITNTQKKTVGFWDSFGNFMNELKWILIIILIFIVLGIVAKIKGLLPFWK